ncbi:Coronin-7 [Coemansia sp. RSA 2559]|nr:Coronin-7 [Coemansia sp. RSA 2559]
MAVLPKRYANIAKCEVLRAFRLNEQSIESIGFRVPRKRPEYFQDDIFTNTLDWETPGVDAVSWIGGAAAKPNYIDLCPQGMTPLSQAPPEPIRRRTFEIQTEDNADNTKDTIKAMLGRVDDDDGDNGSPDPKEDGSESDWDSE